jgi:hypothetical protein
MIIFIMKGVGFVETSVADANVTPSYSGNHGTLSPKTTGKISAHGKDAVNQE